MKTMVTTMCMTAVCAALAGCGHDDDKSYQEKLDSGRKETRVIQAADGIGYGNAGVRKKVDKALDTNDNRIDDLNKQIDSQSE